MVRKVHNQGRTFPIPEKSQNIPETITESSPGYSSVPLSPNYCQTITLSLKHPYSFLKILSINHSCPSLKALYLKYPYPLLRTIHCNLLSLQILSMNHPCPSLKTLFLKYPYPFLRTTHCNPVKTLLLELAMHS